MQVQWEEKDIVAGLRVSKIGEDGKPSYASLVRSEHVLNRQPPIPAFALVTEEGNTCTDWLPQGEGLLDLLQKERWFPCSMPKVMHQ